MNAASVTVPSAGSLLRQQFDGIERKTPHLSGLSYTFHPDVRFDLRGAQIHRFIWNLVAIGHLEALHTGETLGIEFSPQANGVVLLVRVQD